MPTVPAGRDSLRDRTRDVMREQISSAAVALFLKHGFEKTTVADIAAATGISRRTLFRYFASKEDIVLGHLSRQGQEVEQALKRRPPTESPWEALRSALTTLGQDIDPQLGLQIAEMLLNTPSLRARRAGKYVEWQRLLVPEIERRLGVRPSAGGDPGARALIACALACLDIAVETWTSRGGRGDPIEKIFDRAADAVRRR